MKTFKVLLCLGIISMATACSSPGEKAAKEMCGCIESTGIPADELTSTYDTNKINEFAECIKEIRAQYELDENEQKKARAALRENCPDIAKALGV